VSTRLTDEPTRTVRWHWLRLARDHSGQSIDAHHHHDHYCPARCVVGRAVGGPATPAGHL